jgi:hypothetical protein
MNSARLVLAVVALGVGSTTAAASVCRAESVGAPPTVVELYTSEGCSSCPPADRWLSTLKGRPDVLALAFHVDYWDRLGWTDRFASPEITARQVALSRSAGSRSVYTPQVVANGQDWRSWPRLPRAAAATPVAVTLVREGGSVRATVSAPAGAPARLAGYWAVLEDGHVSRVGAGENAGETLRHDHVVRLYRPLPAWPAAAGLSTALEVSTGVAEHPRRVAFVVSDADSGRPLQAAVLGC